MAAAAQQQEQKEGGEAGQDALLVSVALPSLRSSGNVAAVACDRFGALVLTMVGHFTANPEGRGESVTMGGGDPMAAEESEEESEEEEAAEAAVRTLPLAAVLAPAAGAPTVELIFRRLRRRLDAARRAGQEMDKNMGEMISLFTTSLSIDDDNDEVGDKDSGGGSKKKKEKNGGDNDAEERAALAVLEGAIGRAATSNKGGRGAEDTNKEKEEEEEEEKEEEGMCGNLGEEAE